MWHVHLNKKRPLRPISYTKSITPQLQLGPISLTRRRPGRPPALLGPSCFASALPPVQLVPGGGLLESRDTAPPSPPQWFFILATEPGLPAQHTPEMNRAWSAPSPCGCLLCHSSRNESAPEVNGGSSLHNLNYLMITMGYDSGPNIFKILL